jgi:hypothetical protein
MIKPIHFTNSIVCFLCIIIFTACQEYNAQSADHYPSNLSNNFEEPSSTAPMSTSNSETITIYDKGLQMPVANIHPPSGFKVKSDISTNVSTGNYDRYLIEVANGKGELVAYFSDMTYTVYRDMYTGQLQGISVHQICDYLKEQLKVAYFTQVEFGQMSPDIQGMQQKEFLQISQMGQQQGAKATLVQIPLKGKHKGIRVSGKIGFIQYDLTHQFQGFYEAMGTMSLPYLIFASTDNYTSFETQIRQMKIDFNPAWNQAKAQISQRSHEQRMAQNKQNFDAHQRQHKATQDMYQSQNDAWYDRNLGSGSQYNSSASFIDAVTGHTSFNDPETGFKVRQEGHYNHWFTNGQGQYHGTDDPNVKSSDFQGNWQSIQPMKSRN